MSVVLSTNFTLAEFLKSLIAARLGRKVECDLDSVEFENLRRLTNEVLQPLRDLIKRRIKVLSGLRPTWLNQLVGGVENSGHIFGLAGDIEAEGMSARELAEKIVNSDLPFDQCILEYEQWVHVSIAKSGETLRRQVLTAVKVNGKTVYREGL